MINFSAFWSKSLSNKPFKDRWLALRAMRFLYGLLLSGRVNLIQGRMAEGTGLVGAWQKLGLKGVRSGNYNKNWRDFFLDTLWRSEYKRAE
jgi:hypothetical protein